MAIDRSALRAAYRQEEAACVAERLRQAAPATDVTSAAALASRLIEGARERKASGLDAFLQSYGLGTDEGIALMCLAEALLRVPDAETADALIHDKLAGIDWGGKLGDSDSTFVNAADLLADADGRCCRGGSRDDAGFANACAARSAGSASRDPPGDAAGDAHPRRAVRVRAHDRRGAQARRARTARSG
jgi:RHH-type proline utilization regulon transcriptional repressor/proline dehydrogenase/delta 1-pyrroline-5-carboxylate dehydrogenase